MRVRCTRAWPTTTVLALAFAACLARTAGAVPISRDVTFATTGQVDVATGVTGTNVVSFRSLDETSTSTPTWLDLGSLVVAPLAPGQTTTYSHTPISVTFLPQAIDGVQESLTPITATGELNGTVRGRDFSNLFASFNPPASDQFASGPVQGLLDYSTGSYWLKPSANALGHTSVLGAISLSSLASPVPAGELAAPEPATAAVILVGLAGLGLGRRLHRAGKG